MIKSISLLIVLGICQESPRGFALRAARIQISGIGYPNTTGLQSMDYRISDDITDPPDEKSCYTENCFAYLMGSCCYEPISDLPQIGKLPCKDSGFITFGSTHTRRV